MAFLIPEALEVAEILAPFVEEGAITAQEALGYVQNPTEYARLVANNPYVQAVTGAGLLEWEDVKKGVAKGYDYEAGKFANKYNYTYSKGGEGKDTSVKKSVGKTGKLLKPTKIPDYYKPTEKKNTVPRFHRKFTPQNKMSEAMQIVAPTGPRYYLGNKQNVANMGRLTHVKPIVLKHYAKIKSTIARAKCSISGNRTMELACNVGRKNTIDCYYSTRDELNNMHAYAQRNLIAQTGIANKAALTEGVSTDINANSFANQYKTLIIGQVRTYDITNMSDKSCYVTIYLSTPKVEICDLFEACIDDTSFEDSTGNDYIKWSDGVANYGSDDRTVSNIPRDEHRFNPFKHRYKVRRNWSLLAKREVFLVPGQRTKLRVLETGTQLISKIHLDEAYANTSVNIKGYSKNVRFELRGADVVSNKTTNNTQVSKSSTSIAIIEAMHVRLMGCVTTRFVHKYLNQTLSGSLELSTDLYQVNKYGRLPTFDASLQSNINMLTEAKEDGEQKATG